MNQHHSIGMLCLQRRQFLPFEFVMDDARTLPQQHIRARFAADVVAEMAVGPKSVSRRAISDTTRFPTPPKTLPPSRHALSRLRKYWRTPPPCGRGVGRKTLKTLLRDNPNPKNIPLPNQASAPFFQGKDFRALAHETHARHHQRTGFVFRAEARHFQRIAHASARLQSQILNQRIDVIMRHQDRVFPLQQGLDFVFQTTCRLVVGRVGNLRPRLTDLAGGSRRLDEGIS